MIAVEGLVYTYPNNDLPTLRGLNFEIGAGEVFGFLGPSGAGKSTAQKVLYKILPNYKGTITINGKDLSAWDKSYFNQVGVGFELPNHYLKLSGRENLELFASFYLENSVIPAEELFDLVDMKDAIDQKVEAYSKGMMMRLNYVRAIQHNPNILFFDEPTSGLDPVNAHHIKDHIRLLKKEGKTIFITTHDMHTADELCDRVAFIIDGEVKIIDTPEHLKKQYGREAVKVHTSAGQVQEFELKGLGRSQTFLQYIKENEVKKIETLDASLEEVFIEVTGQSLQ